MYLNDIEDEFYIHGIEGINIYQIKLFLLLYADDITLFSETADGLQSGLNVLYNYCQKWRLSVNTVKTKVIVFRKGGFCQEIYKFFYNDIELEIVSSFSYLGIVFTSGGSFSFAQKTLARQAQKAIFKLNCYLIKFTDFSPKHTLDLFDKLVSPILNYAAEVWGFFKATQIERVHLQFCKRLLGIKKSTQNNFIYGESGRTDYQTKRYFIIIYITYIYNTMLADIEEKNRKINWALLVKRLLSNLGFYEVWLQQNVGDVKVFLSVVKERLQDNFIQNWNTELNESSRAVFYRQIASFQSSEYLEIVNIKKFRIALTKLRVSSQRLEIEMGR